MKILVMLISAGLGTLGFNLIFKVSPRHIPAATLGGIISCAVYVAFDLMGVNLFVSNFIAMLVAGIVSEIFARGFRAPAAIFLLPSTIPLVPGGGLYYTMTTLMSGRYNECAVYAKSTLLTGLGIAAGMISASVICGTLSHILSERKAKKRDR